MFCVQGIELKLGEDEFSEVCRCVGGSGVRKDARYTAVDTRVPKGKAASICSLTNSLFQAFACRIP